MVKNRSGKDRDDHTSKINDEVFTIIKSSKIAKLCLMLAKHGASKSDNLNTKALKDGYQ